MSDTTERSEPAEHTPSLRVLTVCTHNRTRSVMMEALLRSMLAERLGAGAVTFAIGGFRPGRHRRHPRCRRCDAPSATGRVRTSEPAGRTQRSCARPTSCWPPNATTSSASRRSTPPRTAAALTLPEFIGAASRRVGDIAGDVGFRLLAAGDHRSAHRRGLLSAIRIEEVDDPTGLPSQAFEAAAVRTSKRSVRSAAAIIARVLEDSGGSAVYRR